ncbi:GNAT family N-acetyltransferase [Lyngbya sp. CCY1209]|uniref:GNAT family N-acetyltransferase n=1 Tax=Lyngbya sp. CCY1209 TaxID=2886103 RepID=UPI002D2014B3|nr:GNAT family N-acetyltransferase [Lyngbya sp. CCY1209]MEB3886548.1 GNAT family N-acetyltransferase [Lyngbya sp. CCY1209]
MEIITTSFAAKLPEIRSVREAVFIREQSVPPHLELDDRDHSCLHVLALKDDKPVGTGRIDIEKNGKIGRLAVLKEYRGQKIGSQLMVALEQVARQNGLSSIWFNAQVAAIPFYQKLGYNVIGEEFMEADIPHKMMRKKL